MNQIKISLKFSIFHPIILEIFLLNIILTFQLILNFNLLKFAIFLLLGLIDFSFEYLD